MRAAVAAAAASLAAAGLMYCGLTSARRPGPHARLGRPPVAARVGCTAPDFTAMDTTGRTWRLRELAGRPVLLAFICGCADCRRVMTALAHAPGPRPLTLVISAVDPDWIQRLTRASGLECPVLVDSFSSVGTAYRSEACPRVWAVDEEQVICYASDPGRPGVASAVARRALAALCGVGSPGSPGGAARRAPAHLSGGPARPPDQPSGVHIGSAPSSR